MTKSYGTFDNDRREYVITDPRTPVKWINYIGTLAFGGYVDHTGGAALCKGDPGAQPHHVVRAAAPGLRLPGDDALPTDACGRRLQGLLALLRPHPRSLRPLRVPRGPGLQPHRLRGPRHPHRGHDLRPAGRQPRGPRHPDHQRVGPRRDARRDPGGRLLPPRGDQAVQQRRLGAADDGEPRHRRPDGRKVLLQYPFMFRDIRRQLLHVEPAGLLLRVRPGRVLGLRRLGRHPRRCSSPNSPTTRRGGDRTSARCSTTSATLQPGETRRLITQLGQEPDVEAALPEIRAYRSPERRRGRLRGAGGLVGGVPRPHAGRDARRRDERDAQRPQPAPVSHHAQLVALPFALPDRARDAGLRACATARRT